MKKIVFLLLFILLIGTACGKETPNSGNKSLFKVVFSKNTNIVVADFDGSSFYNEDVLVDSDVPNWKPSWSKSGNQIVFFRYVSGIFPYNQVSDIGYWKTKLCIINSDGTGYHELTDGTYGAFNSTFLRDGTNRIIYIKMNIDEDKWETWITSADANPGDEVKVNDGAGMSSLIDGRVVFAANNNSIYLLDLDNPSVWIPITIESPTFPSEAIFTRMSVSPDETKILFAVDFSNFTGIYDGMNILGDGDSWNQKDCVLYVADFNKTTLKVTNARIISPRNGDFTYSDGYNRWSPDGKKIFFHSKRSGQFKMYLYDLEKDEGPTLINSDSNGNYYFPSAQNTPI